MAGGDGFRVIQIKEEVFDDLEKIKEKWRKEAALQDYSWTNFLSQVAAKIERESK